MCRFGSLKCWSHPKSGIPVLTAPGRVMCRPPQKGRHMSAVATNPEMLVAPRLSSNAPKVVFRPVSSIAHFRSARKMYKLLRSNTGTCTNTTKAIVNTQKAIRNAQISVEKNDGNFLCRKCAFLRPKLRQIEHAHRKSRCEVLANFLECPARLNAQTGGEKPL